MNLGKKTFDIMLASIFIVAILLSSAIAVPIKNNEAIENNLKNTEYTDRTVNSFIKKTQEKLDNDEILKERIKTNYPQLYDIIYNYDRILTFPIFCAITFITLLTIVFLFWDTIFWLTQGHLLLITWCIICVPSFILP